MVGLLFSALLASGLAGASADCPGPQLQLLPLGEGQWWVPAETRDSNAANRGQVSNTALVLDETVHPARLWALGSGPSPVWGHALACTVQRQLGRSVTDVVSPWARPELVLGVAGLMRGGPLRHWGHAAVAEAMAVQCPQCVDRLRLRLHQPPPAAVSERPAADWQTLLQTAAVLRGDDEAAPAPDWPGLPAGWGRHPWHNFNWQRAWRQIEAQVLAVLAPVAAPAAAASH